ncbi:MAG: PD-(D/E)XK nuclease family protein [Muribaculaceae bacterium]|nr:PD-(D/E)XK nuclease family protein [Muribaculaceae bacterium]
MNPDFKKWLINEQRYSDSTANSRVANILTVERHYGDIDTLIRNGEARNLLNLLSYSTEDERNDLPQKHRIPINGNIRTGSATLKQAVKKYILFYYACENEVEVCDEDPASVVQPIEDTANKEITLSSDDIYNSIFDILGISRLESVHTNFLKWFINKSKDYQVILKLLIQSIVKKAKDSDQLKDCSEVLSIISEGDCSIELDEEVTPEYNVTYNDRSRKGVQNAYVDLVVDASVNDKPIKIIIENKIFSGELNNQTKIYRAYFTGDDSELADGISTFKYNVRYQKGEKKNQVKKQRTYEGKDIENRLYVFLHPNGYDMSSQAKNLSKYFIKYSYQNLLEDVILPSLEEGAFSSEERVWLADYVELLLRPDSKGRVMVEESEESKRLMEFKAAYETYTFAESQKATIPDNAQAETYSQIADDAYGLLGKIGEEEQIRKVKRRVPRWKMRPHQINSKILSLFMELSERGKNGVFLDMLEDEFKSRYSDEAPNFTKNYNQMKNSGLKNHAKVFSEDEEKTVWLWEPVKNFIIETYSH